MSQEQHQLIRAGHLCDGGAKTATYLVTLARWWDAYDRFHDPLEPLVPRLRTGEPAAIEEAIVYLETAPYCHRSGYLAEDLLRRLSRAPLTDAQAERCRAIILRSLTVRQARGWRDIGALAGSLWTPKLAAELTRCAGADAQIARRVDLLTGNAKRWRTANGVSDSAE